MRAIKRNYEEAELPAAERALLDFAVKLTRSPEAMLEADLELLRGHGWSDGAIHDAVQVTALFNYYNRLAEGLGIDPEPEMAGRRLEPRA